MKRAIITLTGTSLLFLAFSVPTFGSDEIRYNRDIRPILSDKCFFCHGPDPETQEADLRLDIEAAAKESVIIPGKPEESEFVFRLTDTEDLMPPEKISQKTVGERDRTADPMGQRRSPLRSLLGIRTSRETFRPRRK